jgi:hypothetical protein
LPQPVKLICVYSDVELYLRFKKDVTLKEYTVNMDMVMSCRGQVEEAALEDPSLIEGPFLRGRN